MDVGETVVDPVVATEPTPGLILTDVASLIFQDKVEELPLLIEVGLAVKVPLGAGCTAGTTVTVCCNVKDPPEPEALNV